MYWRDFEKKFRIIEQLIKITFIVSVLFMMPFYGCTNYKKSTRNQEIEIVKAVFKQWSDAPLVQSDVRERGTDFELIIKNWPEGAEPQYIVFHKRRSYPAEITAVSDSEAKITARVVLSSALLSETSDSVDVSDRLVFTSPGGKERFIEIMEWLPMEE